MLMCGSGVQDGHGENVRESLKPIHRVGQPQMLFSGLAVPSETTSRLIADVPLDDGFLLELGVAVTDFLPLQTPKLLLYSVDLR